MRIAQILFFFLLFCHFTAISQDELPHCEPVLKAYEQGKSTTFYIYAFQTNRFNEVLRVSPVFRITYNYDRAARVDHSSIALRLGRDFNHFVRGLREDGTQTSHEIAHHTQKMGIFMCMNRDAVAEHRFQKIEEFEKWDKKIIEEEDYGFVYKFNAYYKASTQVDVQKL